MKMSIQSYKFINELLSDHFCRSVPEQVSDMELTHLLSQ